MSDDTDMRVLDPRENITHPIEAGQVYRDSRTETPYKLLFVTDDIALLKDISDETSRVGHRIERRTAFEQNVGSGRFELDEEADGTPSKSGKLRRVEELIRSLENKDGRKPGHMAEGAEMALDIITEDQDAIDFEAVSGVGEKTAKALRDSGVVTRGDIRRLDKEELLQVPGVGESNLENIMRHINDG